MSHEDAHDFQSESNTLYLCILMLHCGCKFLEGSIINCLAVVKYWHNYSDPGELFGNRTLSFYVFVLMEK